LCNNAAYSGTTDIFDLFYENKELAQSVFLKPFGLIDVTKMSDKSLKEGGYSGIMEFVMKHIHTRDILVYLEQIAHHLRGIEHDQNNEDFLTSILRYVILNGEADDKTKVIDFIKKTFTEKTSTNMATIAAQFKEEGIKLGEIQGIERGKLEGKEEAISEVVTNLYLAGQTVEFISKVTKSPIQKIQEIINNIPKN